jgi:predicted acylesterase/phospholipase RssA
MGESNQLDNLDSYIARPTPRTALVLSAGAMFGAYQAGVWQALEGRIAIDVVIGASVGSLNGWAIAGGMSATALTERWRQLPEASRLRLRWPRRPLDGFADADYLSSWIQELHSGLRPRCDYGVVMTRVWPFGASLAKWPDVTWQHLAASCAMPLVFPHYRLDGCLYTDGGLLQALPLWAADQFECERVIAVNVLPTALFWGGTFTSRVMRGIGKQPQTCVNAKVLRIQPSRSLGTVRDFLLWDPGNVDRWIAQGYADASRMLSDQGLAREAVADASGASHQLSS